MQGGGLNKKQLESLIYAGAFDCFGKTRSQLIAVYERIMDKAMHEKAGEATGQISFFNMMGIKEQFAFDEYPDIKEFELGEKLAKEKEVAGVYLTGHPLDQYKEHLKKYNCTVAKLNEKADGSDNEDSAYLIEDGATVTIGGMLVEAGKRISKKTGKEFGLGKIEDLYGTVELMLGGFKYSQYKNIFVKDKLVTVTGKVRRRDDTVSISVDRLETWDTVKKGSTKKICFYISFENAEEDTIDRIANILRAYPGEEEAYIKNTDDGKLFSMGITTSINQLMYNELCGLLGEENIKVAQ
jgi:DNA polymerase-3 subunit alpha